MRMPSSASLDIQKLRRIFRRRPERLGLSIDSRTVRIVRLKREEDEIGIAAFGELDLDLWHAGAMEQQRLRSAVRQLGEGIVRVAVGIEHPTLRIRRMGFAKMPERDLLEAIRWNFREQVEGAIEHYVVGYTLLPEQQEEGRMSVVAYGVAEEAVKEYTALVRSVGLKVVSLEPHATALLAAFSANGILDDGKPHVCVSFGEAFTQFIVLRNRAMLFSRPLAGISHDALVHLIMRNLNIEDHEARQALAHWMVFSGTPASQVEQTDDTENAAQLRRIETTVGHFLSQLVIEVQRSIDAFCIMYGVDRVEDIFICGQGVAYPGLLEYMPKTLGISTKVFNPFGRLLEKARQTPEVARQAPAFAVATGLAIP